MEKSRRAGDVENAELMELFAFDNPSRSDFVNTRKTTCPVQKGPQPAAGNSVIL
jgi:hypothetical protein